MIKLQFSIVTACILFSSSASAQPKLLSSTETGQAQVEMQKRIDSHVSAYLKTIGLDKQSLSYCKTKMSLETEFMTKNNGLWPFSYNYNNSKSIEELNLVIDMRESYETIYLKLCLANISNTFVGAKK